MTSTMKLSVSSQTKKVSRTTRSWMTWYPLFFAIGQIVLGDTCSVTRTDDAIVIGKFTWAYRNGKHSKIH